MSDDDALARFAGLGAAWRDRGAEVAEAIANAKRLPTTFAAPANELAEPMPALAVPMPKAARR